MIVTFHWTADFLFTLPEVNRSLNNKNKHLFLLTIFELKKFWVSFLLWYSLSINHFKESQNETMESFTDRLSAEL